MRLVPEYSSDFIVAATLQRNSMRGSVARRLAPAPGAVTRFYLSTFLRHRKEFPYYLRRAFAATSRSQRAAGHTHANWGDEGQCKVVLNAMLWIAKAEVPANGVELNVSPEDLKENWDPNKK